MAIEKIIKGDELYLYMNGRLIFKRWLKKGYSKVFDVMVYDKYTLSSIGDLEIQGDTLLRVKAIIKLRPTSEGGRKTAIASGYRPNHVFYHRDDGKWSESFIGEISFEDSEFIYPGEEREVLVRFLSFAPIEKYFKIGFEWSIYEGANLVGSARILEFIESIPLNKQE